jgi:hypothetical protein
MKASLVRIVIATFALLFSALAEELCEVTEAGLTR